MELTITAEPDGLFVVTCPTTMDWSARMELVDAVETEAANRTVRAVLLDMGNVSYLSSAGLGAICNLLKYVKALGGRLALARPQATILRLLKTVELPRIIPTARSLDDAREILATECCKQ